MSATATEIEIGGLRASQPEPLPFAPELEIRAFLLERPAGNVLIYSARTLGNGPAFGGAPVDRRYLNHAHEAIFLADAIDAPLFVHEADRAAVGERAHVRGAFSRRHTLDDDFEVIPTPGHTPGATAYLWDSGEHRLLFTGDTIYLADGEWTTAVLASSDRAAYAASLELIRELDFDLLVPWAAGVGQAPYAFTDPADARRRIDSLLRDLGGGGG